MPADVLIVDNDERIVELVAWFLEKRGYQVRAAASFEQARERIAERRPELMLSDLDLGAESALEELPRLAAAGVLPPTLVVSGYLDPTIEERLEGLPAVLGTLAKPFDFAALERRVSECLACLAERAPDLMLSDLDLGEQNALDELPAMEAEGCLPPTLVVSGYLDQAARERLQRVQSVLGTLAKPFDFPVLEARVAECLAEIASGPGRSTSPQSSRDEEVEDGEGWIEITPRGQPAALDEVARDSDPLRGAR